MNFEQTRKQISFKIYAFSAIFAFIAVIANPSIAGNSVERGIMICCNIIVPSLFLSGVLSNFLYYTGAFGIFSFPLKIIGKLLNLSACGVQIFIISMLGGYPSGASLIGTAFADKNITAEEAEKLSVFCMCGGPAFIIGAVGYKIFSNISLGIIIYIASVVSNIILALFLRNKGKSDAYPRFIQQTNRSFSENLVRSVNDTAKSIIPMCCFIIFFNAINYFISMFGVFEKIGVAFGLHSSFTDLVAAVFFSLTEVTSGTLCARELGGLFGALLCSFCVSFSGVCIHFQAFSFIKSIKLSYIKFFMFRILSGLISTLFVLPFIAFRSELVPVLSINTPFTLSYNSLISSFFLILLSITSVFSVKTKSFTD